MIAVQSSIPPGQRQEPAHCGVVATLPWWHRDPFDRMLVAQATSENLALVCRDRAMADYGVRVIW